MFNPFDSKKQKLLLIILSGVVVLTVGLYIWYRKPFSSFLHKNYTVEPSQGLPQEIIDESTMDILQEDAFKSLVPHGKIPDIQQNEKGKSNPFHLDSSGSEYSAPDLGNSTTVQ